MKNETEYDKLLTYAYDSIGCARNYLLHKLDAYEVAGDPLFSILFTHYIMTITDYFRDYNPNLPIKQYQYFNKCAQDNQILSMQKLSEQSNDFWNNHSSKAPEELIKNFPVAKVISTQNMYCFCERKDINRFGNFYIISKFIRVTTSAPKSSDNTIYHGSFKELQIPYVMRNIAVYSYNYSNKNKTNKLEFEYDSVLYVVNMPSKAAAVRITLNNGDTAVLCNIDKMTSKVFSQVYVYARSLYESRRAEQQTTNKNIDSALSDKLCSFVNVCPSHLLSTDKLLRKQVAKCLFDVNNKYHELNINIDKIYKKIDTDEYNNEATSYVGFSDYLMSMIAPSYWESSYYKNHIQSLSSDEKIFITLVGYTLGKFKAIYVDYQDLKHMQLWDFDTQKASVRY